MNHDTPTQARIGYFGKIPSRGDFIKAAENIPLIELLDDWLAQTMSLLSENPRWKIDYDESKSLDFAFIGPRKNRTVSGHIIASSDMAQRRFPFLTMSEMEIEDPVNFVSYSPMIFSKLWKHLTTQGISIVSAEDPLILLQNLSSTRIPLELQSGAHHAVFADFLVFQTLDSLNKQLFQGGFNGSVRQLILALGLLLQPVMTSSNIVHPEKSLVLPLPNDAQYRHLVGTFWMHLITPFLLRAEFELALFFVHLPQYPAMVLGFSGASARTLQAILDPQIGKDLHITFDDSEWIEEQVNSDYSLKKLSSYLMHPSLSLSSVLDSFCSTFIGT